MLIRIRTAWYIMRAIVEMNGVETVYVLSAPANFLDVFLDVRPNDFAFCCRSAETISYEVGWWCLFHFFFSQVRALLGGVGVNLVSARSGCVPKQIRSDNNLGSKRPERVRSTHCISKIETYRPVQRHRSLGEIPEKFSDLADTVANRMESRFWEGRACNP